MPTGGPEARPSGITAPEARRTSGSTWPALATVSRRVDLSSLTHAAVTKLSSTPRAENDSLSSVRISLGVMLLPPTRRRISLEMRDIMSAPATPLPATSPMTATSCPGPVVMTS